MQSHSLKVGLWPDGETGVYIEAAKKKGQEPGLSGREAWHTGTFWLMVSAFFLLSVSFNGFLIHLAPMLTDRGVSTQSAALAMSLVAMGAVLGRVGAGIC